jgi:hypothetical protein
MSVGWAKATPQAVRGMARSAGGPALFAGACLVALAMLPAPGSPDMVVWARWMSQVDQYGFVGGYAVIAGVQPPLNSALLGVVSWASREAGWESLLLLKVSTLLFLYATGAVVAYWFRSWFAAAAVVLVSAVNVGLGYLDIWYALPLVLSLMALCSGRVGWFAFLFAVAAMVKAQPLILGPFLAIYALEKLRPLSISRVARQLALPTAVVLVPIVVLYGGALIAAAEYAAKGLFVSGHALNLGLVFTYAANLLAPDGIGSPGLRANGSMSLLPPIELLTLPLKALFLAFYAVVLFRYWQRHHEGFSILLEHAALGFLAYFALSSGVHENHLFVFVLLLTLLAIEAAEYRPWLLTFAILADANLLLLYGVTGTGLGYSEQGYFPVIGGLDLGMPLALVTLGVSASFFVTVMQAAAGVGPQRSISGL